MRALTEAPMSLGERFRAAREERGLTLSEVAEQLRIRSVYLAAIEEENWKAIGAPVYTRGFLRTYARFLNLDPEEAVSEFNAISGAPAPSAAAAPTDYEIRKQQRSLLPFIWIAAVIAVALIGFVIYLYVSPPAPSRSVARNAQSTVAPSPVAQPSPKPTAAVRALALDVTEDSWLKVTVDGNVKIEGTLAAGTTKTFRGKSVLVRAGNAKGVVVTVNGKNLGPMGGEGDVVEKYYKL